MKPIVWFLSLAVCLAVHGAEQAMIPHGGQWAVRDGAVWVDGGPGPKLLAPGTDFADGEAGVEVFFGDGRNGVVGIGSDRKLKVTA